MNMNASDSTYARYGSILAGTPFENDRAAAYIPYGTDVSALAAPHTVGRGVTAPNRIAYQPMEGQDGTTDGTPTALSFDRYRALAAGGAGIIWVEATAICPEGRSNPYQYLLKEENADTFARLCEEIKKAALAARRPEPVVILQLTHSGRYAKPAGTPSPLTAYHNPVLDAESLRPVVSDGYLDTLPALYAHSAVLAERCGFDGVDLKCCHGYLLSELMSATDREGKYGGSFENRSRLLRDAAAAVDAALSAKTVRSCRLNVFDGYGDPHSFCEAPDGSVDLTEAHRTVSMLEAHGVTLLNVTMGSPYRNPDVSRPYRRGLDMPKTNAVHALSRLLEGAKEIKEAHPSLAVVDTGISALGGLSPYAAVGLVEEGMTDFVGFGRMSFAYPSLAADILDGRFDEKKACVCCGGCSTLKKNVRKSGCIIRNPFYREEYKRFKASEQ